MLEVWRPVDGYVNYEVSSLGRVMNSDGIILKTRYNQSGYKCVKLSKNNKKRHFLIHRLVAMAFIPNPKNEPEVNHMDENKANNSYTNLEWCDRKYNMNYGNLVINKAIRTRKAVLVIYPNGTRELIRNMSKFARDNNLNAGCIRKTVSGNQKSHRGYRFIKVPEALCDAGVTLDDLKDWIQYAVR